MAPPKLMSYYNMRRRSFYGIWWHEKECIEKILGLMKSARSNERLIQLNGRLDKARARILAHMLIKP